MSHQVSNNRYFLYYVNTLKGSVWRKYEIELTPDLVLVRLELKTVHRHASVPEILSIQKFEDATAGKAISQCSDDLEGE